MEQNELIPQLFRTEFRKITAVLCKFFGANNIGLAEDIAADTFLRAAETWPYNGIPENPVAWLYTVAKNKARNELRRAGILNSKVIPGLKDGNAGGESPEIDLSESNITDSQLKMLFAVCHPSIPPESQIGLALRVLCGFGIDEIAHAFLVSKDTINKRLFRAREKLREENIEIALPGEAESGKRLTAVLRTLYLLFNEGYYSETGEEVLREELCLEAMRLVYLLKESPAFDEPEVDALLSLMCFHASRFAARRGPDGEMILYEEQDKDLWNEALISKGAFFLGRSARGDRISKYHLEAAIASLATGKEPIAGRWPRVLQLYEQLLAIEYSPVADLNRIYALSKVKGNRVAITEASRINLTGNVFYHALLGKLYTGIDDEKARDAYLDALSLTRSRSAKLSISRKISELGSGR